MHRIGTYLISVCVLLTSGCAQRVDVATERAAIRNADTERAKTAAAKDIVAYLSFYAEDALWLPPNGPIVTGKEAILAYVSQMFANPDFAIVAGPSKVEVSSAGDLGYVVGTYELTINDPAGHPVTDRGKYVYVWRKRASGTWKVVVGAWNSDQPATTE